MNRSAVLTPIARQEAANAVRWAARESPPAGRNLRSAIVDAARQLGQRPSAGRPQPDLVGEQYRIWPLPAFSYILVYDPATTPPAILRMAHNARDLGPLLGGLADMSATDPSAG